MKTIDIKKITNVSKEDAFKHNGNPITPITIHWINNPESIEELTKDYTTNQKLVLAIESYKAVRSNIGLLAKLLEQCIRISRINRKIIDRAETISFSAINPDEARDYEFNEAYDYESDEECECESDEECEYDENSDFRTLITAYSKIGKSIQDEYYVAINGPNYVGKFIDKGVVKYGIKHNWDEIIDNHSKIDPKGGNAFSLINWLIDPDIRGDYEDYWDYHDETRK